MITASLTGLVSAIAENLYIKNDQFIGTREGNSEFIPIFHPYFDEAAMVITFEFDDELNISLSESENEKVKNYCALFELENKYQGAFHEAVAVWEDIQNDIISNYLAGSNDGEEVDLIKLKKIYS